MTVSESRRPQAAVFVDRDGVLNEEMGHLASVEQLQLIPGVSSALRRLNNLEIPVVVVSNQSVVARGICSEDEVREINAAIKRRLDLESAHVDAWYFCPHHPTEGKGRYLLDCECRKPKPGMLIQAAEELGLDLSSSVIVGDQVTDLEAGWRAGCKSVLVLTGHVRSYRDLPATPAQQPDYLAGDLTGAVDWIIRRSTP